MASFNPPTQYKIDDWVEFPAFQKKSTQKDGRCWLNHHFHRGLKGWGQPFLWWQHLEIIQVAHTIPKWPIERRGLAFGGIGSKVKKCKEFAHLPWACLHMAQGLAPFQRLCPHPRHLWSSDQWLRIRTTWIMAALQKPEQILTDFSYNLKITIKWGVCDPLKGCSWRYIKQNIAACLDPSHFIEDMFMVILI